jgi:hypothetical protein
MVGGTFIPSLARVFLKVVSEQPSKAKNRLAFFGVKRIILSGISVKENKNSRLL